MAWQKYTPAHSHAIIDGVEACLTYKVFAQEKIVKVLRMWLHRGQHIEQAQPSPFLYSLKMLGIRWHGCDVQSRIGADLYHRKEHWAGQYSKQSGCGFTPRIALAAISPAMNKG